MSPVVTRPRDKQREAEVAGLMEDRWSCRVQRTGYLDGWDFVGVKDGRTVFIAELKSRNVPRSQYPTVFLSAHKWFRLAHASAALGVAGLFVVRFTDAVLWQSVREIDATRHRIAGRTDREGMPNDRELIIDVPVDGMKVLRGDA